MKMVYECISLLINLLEEKDCYIDNTNKEFFVFCIRFTKLL